jgi:hypothetical protein
VGAEIKSIVKKMTERRGQKISFKKASEKENNFFCKRRGERERGGKKQFCME